jgi:hypothetical protein
VAAHFSSLPNCACVSGPSQFSSSLGFLPVQQAIHTFSRLLEKETMQTGMVWAESIGMKHINDGSGQADRPGVSGVRAVGYREKLVDAWAAAELKVAWAQDQETFEDCVQAATDAAMRLREFDEATLEVQEMMEEGEEEYRLDLHRLSVAESGPNVTAAEVVDEDEKVNQFCMASRLWDWQFLAAGGFDIAESLYMKKVTEDRMEKADESLFLFLTTGGVN